MHPQRDPDYGRRLADAVVQEIWNEMGRQRITSLRELARRANMTHTSINVRMNGDSRTGKQVVLNVRDLAAIGGALGVMPAELVARAQVVVRGGRPEAEAYGSHTDLEPSNLTVVGTGGSGGRSSKADMSSFDDAEAARDEDREKPRID